ncbi:MAG: ThaI family type II restriction endonuclease [Ignavibacteria bacterium]|nr:ThaI family type II restriction endonuclease [Ignavibacteria bacterium]
MVDLFNDGKIVNKIKKRLPYLFQMAELESSRYGKIGMEVGSLREKVIIALLIYKFGENNVNINIPITKAEIDVIVFGNPISIKTISGKNPGGIKLIWTVDANSALDFMNNYIPICDMILVNIIWNDEGSFYYIPIEVQRETFNKLCKEKYIKLPKPGTNPRGVEMSKDAIIALTNHKLIKRIPIEWIKSEIEYRPYERWVELWSEE